MKRRDATRRRAFWGQCFDLWFFCWLSYCASEFLMLMLFYRDTMPHLRDYSVLGWTQHLVFAVLYYLIFTKPAHRLAPGQSEGRFRTLSAVGEFFRRDWRQILLLVGCGVLYEALQTVFPHSHNLFSALLSVPFPSASVISTPVLRTLVGVSLSLASMLLPHLLLRYLVWRRDAAERKNGSVH